MPIPFNCPHCGKHSTVADHYAGQTGPCAACGQSITIPMAGKGKTSSAATSGAMIAIVVGVVGFGLLMVVGVLIALLLPAVQAARTSARRMQSQNNLKQLALSLHNYHDTFQTLPPAYIANDDGSRRTSWRLLVLPFVESGPLHDQYDMGKNWDDPANGGVRSANLTLFQSPNIPPTMPQECHYLLITGKGTAFDGQNVVRFSDMLDGTSNIALAVEVRNQGVEWSQPKDIDIDSLPALEKSGSLGNMGTVLVMMADGSIQQLPAGGIATQLQSMARIADGK